MHPVKAALAPALGLALLAAGCDHSGTPAVVLDNEYPASGAEPLVVYAAAWQAVSFSSPVPPGTSSDLLATVAASDNTAFVVLAPGWDPASASTPTSFVVMQSVAGYGVHLGETLHIPVNDTTFAGDCAAGRTLTQPQADFITQLVFPAVFAGLAYDAATCTTTATSDAGS
jgi:hypothetical protein